MVVRVLFTQHFLKIVGIVGSAFPKEEVQSCTTQGGSDKENAGTMVFFYISIDSAKQTRH